MSSHKSSQFKSLLGWLPGLVISLVAVLIIIQLVNWADLGSSLRKFTPFYIAASVTLTLLFLGVRSIAWRSLLGGRAKISQTFWVINQGYLLNNLLPFRAGEVGRAILLGQSTGLGTAHVLSSIIIERAFDLIIAAMLLLTTLPLALGMAWARSAAVITLLFVSILILFLFMIANRQERVKKLVATVSTHWDWVHRKITPQINSLLNGLEALSNPRQFFISIFWLLLSWVIAVTQYFVLLLALDSSAKFWWGMFTDGVLALGIAIPSAPASLGTFEAAIVGALSVLKIDQTAALAYGVTVHFLQFLLTGILAVIGLTLQGQSLKKFILRFSSKDTKTDIVETQLQE